MATGSREILPLVVEATGDPPTFFDGTTSSRRLYITYTSPYAQRPWIARNYKELREKIKLVPINLQRRPPWYKELYPENKVPALEHNNEVKGESLYLLKYIDSNFEGPALLPDEPQKRLLAEELLSYSEFFNLANFGAVSSEANMERELGIAYDELENVLSKFGDGPFFLGKFSLVDIAYAPFIDRFHPFFIEIKNYDVVKNRPRLAQWIEELNKVEAYKETKLDPELILGAVKRRFGLI